MLMCLHGQLHILRQKFQNAKHPKNTLHTICVDKSCEIFHRTVDNLYRGAHTRSISNQNQQIVVLTNKHK